MSSEVLAAVSEGSNEIGIVYATDAASVADKVDVIAEAPADALKTPVRYPVGLIEDKEASEDDTAAAEAFLEYIKSDDAMKVFEKYGFTAYKARTSDTFLPSLISILFTSSVIPRLSKISLEYCPTGTLSPASAMLAASVMFSNPVTFVSPSLGLIRTTLFSRISSTVSFLARFSSTRASICLSAAEKKISQRAPSSICV